MPAFNVGFRIRVSSFGLGLQGFSSGFRRSRLIIFLYGPCNSTLLIVLLLLQPAKPYSDVSRSVRWALKLEQSVEASGLQQL